MICGYSLYGYAFYGYSFYGYALMLSSPFSEPENMDSPRGLVKIAKTVRTTETVAHIHRSKLYGVPNRMPLPLLDLD